MKFASVSDVDFLKMLKKFDVRHNLLGVRYDLHFACGLRMHLQHSVKAWL
jgi:hypothetical protein